MLRLCNLAYEKGLPREWKLAMITMIPKIHGEVKKFAG